MQNFFRQFFKSHANATYIHDSNSGDEYAIMHISDEDQARLEIVQAYKKQRSPDDTNAALVFETLPVETGIRVRW